MLKIWRPITDRPMEAVGFAVAFFMVLAGIILLLPNFTVPPSPGTSPLVAFIFIKAAGAFFVALFGLHMYGLWKNKYRIRRFVTYTAFIIFLVFGILTLVTPHPQPGQNLNWIVDFILASIEGISYLRLKWRLDAERADL